MKNIIIVIILNLIFASPAFALDSSPSADMKAKVEQFIKDSASKAAQLKKDLEKALQNKAYVGKIKTKSATAITLASKSGPRIVNIT